MFERFTDAAREAVVAAQSEAAALGSGRIGTEHLLLGVAAVPGRAGEVLAAHGATPDKLRSATRPQLDRDALATLGIDLDEVRRRVEASFGPGALESGRRRKGGYIPFTPEAKKALELALREALSQGDKHIGGDHVLLGLLRDEKTEAVAVLSRVGASREAVRAALAAPVGTGRDG
jgi:ATP-dependent Clp protease ATP-binding subunit ClpA